MNIQTGLHWCSPVSPGTSAEAQRLLQASGRWGSVIILPYSIAGQIQGDFKDACDKIFSILQPLGQNLSQVTARIWMDQPIDQKDGPPDIPDDATALSFLEGWGYIDSLNYFTSLGGKKVVIFNEPNMLYPIEPQSGIHPIDIARLAFCLNNAYWNGGDRKLWTYFPGPSGLQGWSGADWDQCFLGFWQKYDFLDANGLNPMTFGKAFPDHIAPDDVLFNRTMLWHGGTGVFDRVALHAYASDAASLADPNGPAIQYIKWMKQIDPTTWFDITESSGFCGNNEECGAAEAQFMANADQFYPSLQTLHGYILDQSNHGATSGPGMGGDNQINDPWISGFNAKRATLGF